MSQKLIFMKGEHDTRINICRCCSRHGSSKFARSNSSWFGSTKCSSRREFTRQSCRYNLRSISSPSQILDSLKYLRKRNKNDKATSTMEWCLWSGNPEILRLIFWRLAPELFTKYRYSTETDVWSFGILCLEILTQEVPYPDVPMQGFIFAFGKGLRPQKCIETSLKEMLSTVRWYHHQQLKSFLSKYLWSRYSNQLFKTIENFIGNDILWWPYE